MEILARNRLTKLVHPQWTSGNIQAEYWKHGSIVMQFGSPFILKTR